jgi:hypothetical protein
MKRSDDANCRNLRRFLYVVNGTTRTKSPKDFNMDNPLQAEGAARGIGIGIEWRIYVEIADKHRRRVS